jgi:membrane-associated PAP2 superfamily phosphatase
LNNPQPPDFRASRAQAPVAELAAIPASFPCGLIGRLARARIAPRVLWQLLLPLAAFVAANVVLLQLGGDRWIAGHLYLWEGGHWALKDNLVTSTLIHQVGKRLSTLAWLGVVVCTLVAWRRSAWRAWRKPLLYLALAVLLSTSLVAWMKSWTHVDCPWDLVGFGGTRSYHDLLTALPLHAAPGRCFPAGHASAGYAWLALFFFLGDTRPQLRWKGFAVGLGAGVVFGIAQQLRGAHFASHDAWTLMLCWLVAVLLHRAMFARRARGQATNAAAPAGPAP